MAGILNRTARQFNLKAIKDGHRAVIRVAPGFNVVPDEHWKVFVDGRKVDPYVAELKKKGFIDFGSSIDDLELEQEPDTKAKSKLEPVAKLKEAAAKSAEEAEKATMENSKLKAELDKANAEAEKAKLELENLKKASSEKQAVLAKTETKSK